MLLSPKGLYFCKYSLYLSTDRRKKKMQTSRLAAVTLIFQMKMAVL